MKKTFVGLLVLLGVSMTAQSQVKVGFEVSFIEPQAHYAEIEMNISGLSKDFVDIKMPVWTPGSYLVREFSKNIESLTATVAGKPARFEKVKKNAWRIYGTKSGAVKINYRVYANEISVRTSFIDASHAFISTSGIFMYPDGMLKLPSTVTIKPFDGWSKVSTGLAAVKGKAFTYTAPDFDILFDSPIEVGNQEVFEFMASGVIHEVAMVGGGNYDVERLKIDMAKVVEQSTAIYDENPNKHYTFIVHNSLSGGGGLEHLNSTVLGATRNAYSTTKGYKDFLKLVAHEYYHLWNVKRLRPMALGPFDYENENYTTNLWIAEGFTSYYESKLMYRAGLYDLNETIGDLIAGISTVMNTPGSRVQSAAESSYDAWIKGYRPNENSNNSTISYYSKGKIIGLLMDLEISNSTKGAKNLDDVMKAMYAEYYKKLGRGYTDAEFKVMVEKISGVSFTDFWKKYVNGTDPIEYAKYFNYAGIEVKDENEGKSIPYLGLASKKVEGNIIISSVSRNSAAWVGGLNVNDQVIGVDGVPVEAAIERMPVITSKNVGDEVTVMVKRDGLVKDIVVKLKANPNVKLIAEIDAQPTDLQKAVLKVWL